MHGVRGELRADARRNERVVLREEYSYKCVVAFGKE